MQVPSASPEGGQELLDPEQWRRYVDKARLDLDIAKEARESRYFSKNAPALIAAAIALVGAAISAVGIYVSALQKAAENERELAEDRRRDLAATRDYDYKWRIDMLQFVERYNKELFSQDTNDIIRMQSMMQVAFPPDQANQLVSRFQLLASRFNAARISIPTKPGAPKKPPQPAPTLTAEKAWEAAPPPIPTLSGASIAFQTTDNDKDADTSVSISVECGGRIVAKNAGTWGKWPDSSTFGPIPLIMLERPARSQMAGSCRVTIVETPVGHDEWHFNWTIHLEFSDGKSIELPFNGGNVDHDRTTVSRPLAVAA